HSSYETSIDLYTFLPSVLESRRGVCLGVSVLYLALAQRLGIPLEIVTPPGHIFLRLKKGDKERNIETTCRGVHVPSDEYLGVNNKKLPLRSMREVVGMVFFNQASIFLNQGKFEDAVKAYKEAILFMPDDVQL